MHGVNVKIMWKLSETSLITSAEGTALDSSPVSSDSQLEFFTFSVLQTAYIPEKERYHVTKSQLLAMMDTMMGGRAAEELLFCPDKITSGASSDLQVVFTVRLVC
jgi:hypothetical protein